MTYLKEVMTAASTINEDYLQQIDQLIKSGDFNSAWRSLRAVKLSDVPRENLSELSSMARRLQRHMYSLKILSRVITGHSERSETATVAEIISFANSLIKLGSFEDARRWLTELDGRTVPETYDLRARIHIAQWDYVSAISELKKYVAKVDRESYGFLIGHLNLAASYIATSQTAEALELIPALLERARRDQNRLVLGNLHELQAQAHLVDGRFEDAKSCLSESHKYLGFSESIYAFYVKKWNLIADLRRQGPMLEVLIEARRLKAEAKRNGYWEDVREIDRTLALHGGERPLLEKLYFGTVHESYRRRLLEDYDFDRRDLCDHYVWRMNDDEAPSEDRLTLDTRNAALQSPTCTRLLKCLTHDFYRPLSFGYVHSNLYPGEHINPLTSPSRVYRSISRLRQLLPNEYGLKITWDKNGISLKSNKPIVIVVSRSRKSEKPEDQELIRIQKLREIFGREWFTSSQASARLGISLRSVQTLLSKARDIYSFKTKGFGRATRYRFS